MRYALFCIFFSFTLHAETENQGANSNLRELCRSKIAGLYLNAYDKKMSSIDYKKALHEKSKIYKEELNKKQIAIDKKHKSNKAQSDFDIMFHDEMHRMEQEKKQMSELFKQTLEEEKKTEITLKEAEEELTSLKKRVETVFRFETLKGKGHGYKFRLEYKSSCPPYRLSCPLPKHEANALKKLLPENELPLECQRYTGI